MSFKTLLLNEIYNVPADSKFLLDFILAILQTIEFVLIVLYSYSILHVEIPLRKQTETDSPLHKHVYKLRHYGEIRD